MKLSGMEEGKIGRIIEIDMPEQAKKRLLHVGVYEGADVKMERKGRRQKPSTLLVCGNFLMMRYAQCEQIEVKQK